MRELDLIELPFDLKFLPFGYLCGTRVNLLYQLARRARSILEVGPWVGRSTVVIAKAIADGSRPVPFHSVDFFIKDEAEWLRRFGSALSAKPNADRYRACMRQPGGSRAVLERNLVDRDLRHLVAIHEGDFLDVAFGRRFDFIFCDATHDAREIDRSLPGLLARLEPGGVIACDDISNARLEAAVKSHARFRWAYRRGRFFYGEPTS